MIQYFNVSVHTINPRYACVARVTVLGVCECVCLSGTTGYEVANRRYQRFQNNESLKMVFSLKRLRSRDMV